MTNISRSINQKLGTLSGVLLALLLCLTGCQKERFVPEEDLGYRHTAEFDEGSTYMSLTIRTNPPTSPTTDPASQPQTGTNDGKESQTGDEDFTTWQGDDIIENFAVYIVSEGIDKVQCIAGSVSDNKLATWNATKQELLLNPFRSAPVSKRIFAFFNIPTQYQKYLDEALNNRKQFLERISEPIPYTGAQGITYDQDAPILDAFRPDSHIATKVIKNEQIGILSSMSPVGRGSDEEKPWFVVDFPNEFIDHTVAKAKDGGLDFNKRSDRIFASGEKYNYLPEDNITKEEVENDRRNLVQVYTRRVLAQAVVTVEGSLVERPNFSGLHGMQIVGLSFQVLNFDPTFYPVAKTTKEGDWPGNSNTVSPLYGKNDNNNSRVNLSNYRWSYSDETFDLESLIVDRYFRSAHFVYDHPSIKELKQDDPLYAQKLMREREISTDKKIDGFDPIAGETTLDSPKHTTTFWGSCYVTESTQRWGTDSSSGYTTSNTPFFAIVASFDTESLPWGDNTIATAKAKINNKQKDLDKAVKAWKEQLAAKEKELADLPEGADGKKEEEEANAAYKKWYDYIVECVGEGRANSGTFKGYFNEIVDNRNQFKSGTLTEEQYIETWTKKRSKREKIRGNLRKEYQKTQEDKYWTDTFNKDKVYLKAKNDPYAKKRQQLTNEIDVLKKKINDFENEFKSSNDKYPKKEHSEDNLEFFTQFIYEQGVTRIFYSQVDGKFYLNYHEIPLSSRPGQRHTLTVDDPWLSELKSKLPNGKEFPTEANGAPDTAAVLPPDTPGLMEKLSRLLNNDQIKETDLSPEERRSMDFYLYGRVAPGLVQYFGGAKRIDRIDLQGGYVAWYSAHKKDNVVSYPCYVRNKKVDTDGKETKSSISNVRLMMVYYAWLNPNTKESDTTYASPVLRNNIYHMHITGFTKMGLSAIPFVPRVTEGNGYKFLHWKLDPDEEVPTANAPLNATSGSGSPTSLLTPRSSSFSLTF